jgi:hypothetical protein
MRYANEALNDDAMLEIIQQELSKRCQKSKTRGRPSTPADVVLRMLRGSTRAENKIVSVFERDTEVIRKGKASIC